MKKLGNSVSDHESIDNKNIKQRVRCRKAQRTGKAHPGSHNGDCQTVFGGALPCVGRAVTTDTDRQACSLEENWLRNHPSEQSVHPQ